MSATKTGEKVNMKKIVLSTLVALSIATVASASDVKLYQDANGQVFTQAADGRTAIEDKSTPWFSKTDKLDFSMLVYAGYQNTDYRANSTLKPDVSQFELRRAYFQVKAHLLQDPKSYFRITLDTYNDSSTNGNQGMRIKYAFLYLNDILPYTGLEAGIAHTTWLDYEEHNGWDYRNILETFSEHNNGGRLQASSDRGVNFKTNTKYFSSEVGIFNGEGYNSNQPTDVNRSMGMAYEARATVHVLGVDGRDSKKTFWDISLFGKENTKRYTDGTDLKYLGVHSVFNTENLLVGAQYIKSTDTSKTATPSVNSGSGYSINADLRGGDRDQYHLFGRYDNWTPEVTSGATKYDDRTYILGTAWDMNKNVQLVANVITRDNQSNATDPAAGIATPNGNQYMLTAQVEF